nr:immunoglobulin heavy chain junction region [Macaca mulatta]MOW32324.1 immunoglobulin heavy chain junction region [Macaca mulatta]MOW32523.1 immunoglobulin heavy chain junction region [Macaca mulatta]MOW32575.1 immunoglobulin heavy chain junction region [Macaca mulatta]MOW32696.1 immunoglobulin heavy chain junction region [Macaca mulatta]
CARGSHGYSGTWNFLTYGLDSW